MQGPRENLVALVLSGAVIAGLLLGAPPKPAPQPVAIAAKPTVDVLPEATVLALADSNDLVLLGNGDPAYEGEAMASVSAAVLAGRLDRASLHESAMRVNRLRDKCGRRFSHGKAVKTV